MTDFDKAIRAYEQCANKCSCKGCPYEKECQKTEKLTVSATVLTHMIRIMSQKEEASTESMDKLRIENSELIQRIVQLERDLAKERDYNYAIVTVIKNNYPMSKERE